MVAKQDDLSPDHLEWLVKSRAANQSTALKLFKLLEKYPSHMKSKGLSPIAQALVAITFSLWRAAFLADKTGTRQAVLEDARLFLGKMLTDNAITYPQDRSTREWTFNYYMNNARDNLLYLSETWNIIEKTLSIGKKAVEGTKAPHRRWNRHQKALDVAVDCLAKDLGREKAA